MIKERWYGVVQRDAAGHEWLNWSTVCARRALAEDRARDAAEFFKARQDGVTVRVVALDIVEVDESEETP